MVFREEYAFESKLSFALWWFMKQACIASLAGMTFKQTPTKWCQPELCGLLQWLESLKPLMTQAGAGCFCLGERGLLALGSPWFEAGFLDDGRGHCSGPAEASADAFPTSRVVAAVAILYHTCSLGQCFGILLLCKNGSNDLSQVYILFSLTKGQLTVTYCSQNL